MFADLWKSWMSTSWSDFVPSPGAHQHADLVCVQSAASDHHVTCFSPQWVDQKAGVEALGTWSLSASQMLIGMAQYWAYSGYFRASLFTACP